MTLRALFVRLLVAIGLVWAPLAHAGDLATNFTLRNLEGTTVNLTDYQGKVIFVDFWATWCGPCKDAMPHWEAMYKDLADDGLVVLAVTTDDARTTPQVKPFIKRMGYTYPVLLDTSSSALVVYNPAKTLPYSVLIDRSFHVHSVHQGYTPGDEASILAEVKALLVSTPVQEPVTVQETEQGP